MFRSQHLKIRLFKNTEKNWTMRMQYQKRKDLIANRDVLRSSLIVPSNLNAQPKLLL